MWSEAGDGSVLQTLIHRLASINPDKQTGSQGLHNCSLTSRSKVWRELRNLQKPRLLKKKASSCKAQWDIIRGIIYSCLFRIKESRLSLCGRHKMLQFCKSTSRGLKSSEHDQNEYTELLLITWFILTGCAWDSITNMGIIASILLILLNGKSISFWGGVWFPLQQHIVLSFMFDGNHRLFVVKTAGQISMFHKTITELGLSEFKNNAYHVFLSSSAS